MNILIIVPVMGSVALGEFFTFLIYKLRGRYQQNLNTSENS